MNRNLPGPGPTPVPPPADETPRDDPGAELDQWETFDLLLNDAGVRNYAIAGLAGLAVVYAVLMERGGEIGGLLVVVIGAAGLALRWAAAPFAVLGLLIYFLIFPLGVPVDAFEKAWEIAEGHFRLLDILFAWAVVVYVAAHYRVLSIVWQVAARDGRPGQRQGPLLRRPSGTVSPTESVRLVIGAFVAVLVAQVVWWVANSVELRPERWFPFAWVGSGRTLRRWEPPGGLTPGFTRFLVLMGLSVIGVLLARLMFGYWRLRVMSPAEAAMMLQDAAWAELARESSRIESWRAWNRRRGGAERGPSSGSKVPADMRMAR